MLIEEATDLYKNLRLMHYQSLFGRIHEKEGSLSATEAFSVDAIYILNAPTIKQFSDFLGISQPNASYKLNNLVAKGYVKKVLSEDDHREYHLYVAEKFYSYYDEKNTFLRDAVEKLETSYNSQQLELFEKMLRDLNESL